MKINIGTPTFPIIAAAIHDGHKIRDELKEYLFINDSDRLREEDPFTGNWITISDNNILVEDSRFEVDLNRPREKAVYLKPKDSWGLKVWNSELTNDVYERSIEKYDLFYKELQKSLDLLVKNNQYIILYDLHTYNYRRNGADVPPEPDELNPELNLGTGTLNRDKWAPVIDRFISDMKNYNFLGKSLDVRENIKFKGGNFARWIHEKYPESVCCLSIEFRKFFMDEWTGTPNHDIIDEIGKALKYSIAGVQQEINKIK